MEGEIDLREQIEYYRARSAEYDQWWLRQGRYDRGAALNAQWFAEAGILASAVDAFRPTGRVLDLACGTGIWSQRLAPFASSLTLLDGSPEMLSIALARLRGVTVRTIEVDLFQWQPSGQFDVVFFGFWLSHVPPERFAEFWQLVSRCLAPDGRVFFVDSRYDHTSTAVDHRLSGPEATVASRRLNDGREYRIVKVFYEPTALAAHLRRLGWSFQIDQTANYFLYGHGTRAGADG